MSGAVSTRPVNDLPELRVFLKTYHAKILQPLELPAIQRAFAHAGRNELRELIALDQQLSGEPAPEKLRRAQPSHRPRSTRTPPSTP